MTSAPGEAAVAVHDTGSGRAFEIRLRAAPEECLARLEELAETWGAHWQPAGLGGRLALPVRAGVRTGVVQGPVSVRGEPGGSHLRLDVEDGVYRVQFGAFFLLLLGALGGLTTLFAPFVPRLVPLLPVGVVMAVAAWFLIVQRLANSGPEEFLGELARSFGPAEE